MSAVLDSPEPSTVPVTVRPATADDYAAADVLFKAQLGEGFTLDAKLWNEVCTLDTHLARVAVMEDGAVAGLAIVVVSDRIRLAHGIHRRRFHLDHLITLPSHRRQGIGKHLLEAVIAIAKEQTPSYIIVNCEFTNVAARRTYESAGLYLVRQASDRFEIAFS